MAISDYDVDIRQSYQLSSQQQLIQIDQDFQRKGYRIAYWTQNADGSGRRYALEETLQAAEVSADIDFHAQWEKLGLVMTATNGKKSYFDASDSLILSSLGYVNGSNVKLPYSNDANISNYNTVVAVDDYANEISDVRDYAFQDCTNLLSVNLPAATSIGNCAFQDCTNLLSVNLPVATSIKAYAFMYCDNLSSVNLPAATSIHYCAFDNCTDLLSVNLPAATSIDDSVFWDCANLSIINLSAVSYIPTIQLGTFDIQQNLTAIVPSALVDDFRQKTNWSYYYATGNLTLSLPHKTAEGYWKGNIYNEELWYCDWNNVIKQWFAASQLNNHIIYYSNGLWCIDDIEIPGNGTETELHDSDVDIIWTPNNPF